jgi:hypothetical protein
LYLVGLWLNGHRHDTCLWKLEPSHLHSLRAASYCKDASQKKDFVKGAVTLLWQNLTALLACFLAFYALAAAIVFPRLFAGDVSAFIPVEGHMTEARLAPVGGNFTQTSIPGSTAAKM